MFEKKLRWVLQQGSFVLGVPENAKSRNAVPQQSGRQGVGTQGCLWSSFSWDVYFNLQDTFKAVTCALSLTE